MKKTLSLILLLFAVLSLHSQPWVRKISPPSNQYRQEKPASFNDLREAFYEHWKDRNISTDESENAADGGYQQFARYEYMMRFRTYPHGEMYDQSILLNEYAKIKATEAANKSVQAGNWMYVGQFSNPISGGGTGRINVVRQHPSDPNTLYIGAACGGFWKSTDAGATWITSTDFLPSIAIADIAINPQNPDIIYIATGDGYGYETGSDFWGGIYTGGIYKSTDGGDTWAPASLSFFDQFNKQIFQRIIVHPNDPDIVLTCSRNYLYRSDNAGLSWSRILSGHFYDLEFKPGDPDVVYAASGNAVFKSTDAGLTFPSVTVLTGGSGRMSIDVTAANPDVIYAMSESGNFWKSTDGAQTFTAKTSPASQFTFYGYYDNVLAVSPADENVVIAGGIELARSNNGGTTWFNNGSAIHVDQKNVEFVPGSSSSYYVVNDGGIYKTTTAGTSWTNLGDNIYIKQYYRIASAQSAPTVYYAGAQDNGTDQNTGSIWRKVYGGDGMDCAVNPLNASIALVSSQYGNFRRTTNGGNSFVDVTPSGQSGDWITPVAIDPVNPNNVYLGYQNLYRSVNGGASFSSISSNVLNGSDFIRIKIAPSNPSVILASSINTLKRSTDGGFTFNTISLGLPLSSFALTDVEVSSSNPDHIWVTLSGYGKGTKVFRTSDAGANWINISGSLPNLPVNCIAYQPGSCDMVYIGTDIGVYYRDNTMGDWQSFNTDLPRVIISDLEIIPGISKIRAGTYGRGIWESDLAPSVCHSVDAGIISFSGLPPLVCTQNITPAVLLENFGTSALTSCTINFIVDNGPVQSISWTGNLAALNTTVVALPQLNLTDGNHTLHAFVSDPNGMADPNSVNDAADGTCTIASITVNVPVIEGFESSFPPAAFRVDDVEGILTHHAAFGAFGTSAKCMRAGFYDNQNANSSLTSYLLNFSGLSNPPQISFDVAYKRIVPSIKDSLIVLVSADCGVTWTKVYQKIGSALATAAGFGVLPFNPTAGEWRNEVVSLAAYSGMSEILIRFSFVSNYGHYLYLDNINIDQTVGIDETSVSDHLVYPNPASGMIMLRLSSVLTGKNLTVELSDISGRKVLVQKIPSGMSGNDIPVSVNLSSGSYSLSLISDGEPVLRNPVIISSEK